MVEPDRDGRPAWRLRSMAARLPSHDEASTLWIRDCERLPAAGVIVSPSVLSPFSLNGLGLVRVNAWGARATPPVLSRLAIDLTDPYAVSITYRERTDDAEAPLARGVFAAEHSRDWIEALAGQQHVLLSVSDDYAFEHAARASAGATRAPHGGWVGLIACGEDCVGRSQKPLWIPCSRHHRLPDHRQADHGA